MPKSKFSYNYGTSRDYKDRTLNQHYAERKTTEADIRAEEAESGQSLHKAMKERNQNYDRMSKATIDERKFNDQRGNYRTAEQRKKDQKAESDRRQKLANDESKLTRAERYRRTTQNARQYQAADKSERDWKSHKYIAKVKTKNGKVRYIYEDTRRTKSNGAELPKYNENKWTANDRRRIENETGRDMSDIAKRENAELDRKTKLTRDERKFQDKEPSKNNRSASDNSNFIPEYNSEKISEADRRKWNNDIDARRKASRDERNSSGENVQNDNRNKISSEKRKNYNAELDRKTKLSRDERKFQNSQSSSDSRTKREDVNEDNRRGKKRGAVNPNSSSDDGRIKRDEVNEDTRKGNKRSAVNPNSATAGHNYTNNYIREYGNMSVNSL